MCGFLIGFACLIGLLVVLKCARRRHGGWGGHCGPGCGPRGGHGGWSFRSKRDMFLRHLFERLETMPGQEKAIKAALDELFDTAGAAKQELHGAREQLAALFRSEAFDETLLSGVITRHDEAVERVRNSGVDTLTKIYEALDPRQRAIVADWLESKKGGPFWNHPYRSPGKV